MKKSFIVALMMTTFLTGCQTEASAINGSKASNRIAEDAVDTGVGYVEHNFVDVRHLLVPR